MMRFAVKKSLKVFGTHSDLHLQTSPISAIPHCCWNTCAKPTVSRTLPCWISVCRNRRHPFGAKHEALRALLPDHFPQQLPQLCNRGIRNRAYLLYPKVAAPPADRPCAASSPDRAGRSFCADHGAERWQHARDRAAGCTVSGA